MADYRIALRPTTPGEDPTSVTTEVDDIVVKDVSMFRAEQIDPTSWHVSCDMEGVGRVGWAVRVVDGRLVWVTIEFPVEPVLYEHDVATG